MALTSSERSRCREVRSPDAATCASNHRLCSSKICRSSRRGGAWLCLHQGVQEERGSSWARRSRGTTHGERWALIASATNRKPEPATREDDPFCLHGSFSPHVKLLCGHASSRPRLWEDRSLAGLAVLWQIASLGHRDGRVHSAPPYSRVEMGAGCPGSGGGAEPVRAIPGVQQARSGVAPGSDPRWGSGCCSPPEHLVTEERVWWERHA